MIKLFSFLRFRFLGICVLFGCCSFSSLATNEYNIIPYPRLLIPQNGSFTFNKRTTILCSFNQPEILKLAQQFSAQFQLVSGIKLSVRDITKAQTNNVVIIQTNLKLESSEAYRLSVSPKAIHIKTNGANGAFYALQSLYQLLPPEIYGKKEIVGKKWSAPAVEISDAPRFAYRGLHLDVCRHYFSVEFIKKYIDAMAIHKLNTFHWHLTEDQGWRIEIKKYPRLTTVGSKRDETMVGYYYSRFPKQYDGKPYGGYYTQEEAKEIVAYAKERFITIIPEIELPGHAQAAIAAYPYLSCTQDSTVKVATRWGIFPEVYCPRESTFTFLEDVLTEVMAIFPGKYIHIGGDECPKDRWKTCPDCQALIKNMNLKDENGLQSYFVERIEQFVNSKGRQIIGWDEILDGGLAPNATVMSWRGNKGGLAAAKAGHDVIMTPVSHCYFDKYQADPTNEPITIGGYLPLQTVYQFEPVPDGLTELEAQHVLGAQANLWTEYMPSSESVEYMAFPRVAAMAEVLWSSKQSRNWDRFSKRLPVQFNRYEQVNINACKAFFEIQFQSNITANKQVQIVLTCDCPDVQIRYNTTGKVPTISDILYKEPFTLDESATVTAASFVKGKSVGKAFSKAFQVSKLTGLSYTKNGLNTTNEGANLTTLTDGVPGNTIEATQWVYIGKGADGEIVLDMQKVQTVEHFSVGLLNSPAIGVLLPTEIKLYGSTDSANYQLLAEKQIAAESSPLWKMFRPEMTFAATGIRYLKLVLKNAGDCPTENKPTASAILMDEIGAW